MLAGKTEKLIQFWPSADRNTATGSGAFKGIAVPWQDKCHNRVCLPFNLLSLSFYFCVQHHMILHIPFVSLGQLPWPCLLPVSQPPPLYWLWEPPGRWEEKVLILCKHFSSVAKILCVISPGSAAHWKHSIVEGNLKKFNSKLCPIQTQYIEIQWAIYTENIEAVLWHRWEVESQLSF